MKSVRKKIHITHEPISHLEYCWLPDIHADTRILGFPDGWVEKNQPAMQESQKMRVQSLVQEDPLEEGMATHSRILAWRIPRTKEPGGLQSMGSQRVRRNWSKLASMHTRFVTVFLPRSMCLNFMIAVIIRSDFEAQENKMSLLRGKMH